jgi:hypothetical protein
MSTDSRLATLASGVGGGTGEVGDEERLADEAEELDERGEHADARGDGEERGISVVDGA